MAASSNTYSGDCSKVRQRPALEGAEGHPRDTAPESRTIGRLEAFSDIVIGFCIAQMGLNLLIPKNPNELSSIATGAIGVAVSFVLLSILWWFHHRLFARFFVLNALTVSLNFAMLGSLVFMVYLQQISLHFIASGQNPASAIKLWLLCYGVVYAFLAAMLWIGVTKRWDSLQKEDLRWGLTRGAMVSGGAIIFLAYGASFGLLRSAHGLLIPAVVLVSLRFLIPPIVNRTLSARG